ncbi:DUF1674 domain-containing protein [Elstera sp.]|jgi:hypothetical protein|uniref:DUF1674 domain-containing protein n=1 Tax=Elstera sp. TaxID=1916664 RepID=UPI0037BF0FE9
MPEKTEKPEKSQPEPLPPVAPVPETKPTDPKLPKEFGGPQGPEPTRFGDWEKNGRCSDF